MTHNTGRPNDRSLPMGGNDKTGEEVQIMHGGNRPFAERLIKPVLAEAQGRGRNQGRGVGCGMTSIWMSFPNLSRS